MAAVAVAAPETAPEDGSRLACRPARCSARPGCWPARASSCSSSCSG